MADIDTKKAPGLSRREFVTGVGGTGAGLVFGGLFVKGLVDPKQAVAIAASEGYIVVDTCLLYTSPSPRD